MLADRLSAQRLTGVGVRTPEQAVGHLLAVQAQDPRGARLSIRARTSGVSAADVDAGLSERRTLLITWLNRGTLHLVQAEDYWWLQPLTTPQLATGVARRLAQEGVSAAQADRGLDVIAEQVSTLGPRTRSELRTALEEAGVPTAGQALVHILASASLRGDLVRGPMRGAEHCFVSAEAWLGARPRAARAPGRTGTARPPLPHRTRPRRRTRPRQMVRHHDQRRPHCDGGHRRRARRARRRARRPGRPPADAYPSPRHGYSDRSTRSCTAGPPARSSSAATKASSPATDCSDRSPSRTGARSPPGASHVGR